MEDVRPARTESNRPAVATATATGKLFKKLLATITCTAKT
jgi:hypothetical protein